MNEDKKIMDVNFKDVYCKYYKSIYRYLITITKNEDIADEIAQETFFKAMKNINKYDSSKKMFTWLCEIAKNTYFSEYKKRKKLQELNEFEFSIDEEADIIDKIIDSESKIKILKLLHQLEDPYKEVFTLRIYGDLTFKQIGEIFNKSEDWARVTYYRSKLKIKENFDENKL